MRNQLEGKRVVGVVLAGGSDNPDPKELGRVRVGAIGYQDPNQSDLKDILPWSSISSKDDKQTTRPPQEGTLVSIYYPHGTKSSMRGVVEYVYPGMYNGNDIPGNETLVNMGWFKEARDKIPAGMKGYPNLKDVIEKNISGAEKVIGQILEKGPVPTINQRIGLIFNLNSPVFLNFANQIKNVATAETQAIQAMTSELANSIPGLNFAWSMIEKTGIKELDNAISQMRSVSPLSGTNFAQMAERVSQNGINQAVGEMKNMMEEGQHTVEQVLRQFQQKIGSEVFDNISVTLLTPFGIITQIIDSSGNILTQLSDIINQVINQFLGSISGIVTQFGSMLGNSSIPNEMLGRLPVEAQAKLKEAIEKIPQVLPKALQKAASF